MDQWWINGRASRHVDVSDRGFTYADGLFETVAIRAGTPRFLDLHLDRLLTGCGRLSIAAPTRARLAADLKATVRDIPHGVLKVFVTRGPGPRGYALPDSPTTTVAWGTGESRAQPSLPIEIRWCETMTSANPATAGLKSLGRLEQVLARAEWQQPEIAEGLMLSTEGQLVGGTASNVFLVTGDRLLTPVVHRAGIAGVMRRVVVEAAMGAGIPFLETQLSPADVRNATEVFVTNALTGIRPVRQLGAQNWGTGPITRHLCGLLFAAGVGECAGQS
ncbi:MAG: aminodeoxychorismate lyase [Gammaproteobacteria bacterium]|nr:aminodeoxychorismate lyase [Gammaproteobacteria bacterium]